MTSAAEDLRAAAEYFTTHYASVRLPLDSGAGTGLRRSQLGAIHALCSHFTLHETPALVVLPTGAGKTAVLMLTPFLLGARRALVVTPSRLVRDQVARQFESLAQLRRLGALPDQITRPEVKVVRNKLADRTQWAELLKYSVAVGTPHVLSPALEGVAAPPQRLFDTILIDEGHHAPARTWQGIIDTFPDSRVVLFTATPFRRDGREIKGRIVYSYPLRRAVDDGIYGQIRYHPVAPTEGQASDVAIAIAAEETLRADRANGLRHLLMVRTDSKSRANELARTYEQHTGLHLRVIHSGHSERTIDSIVADLRAGQLDGIVAVSMMGEGFDLPELKVAAIHAPHRSLEVTLQFIGRFARTAGHKIGGATFLAVPNEIEIARERLYRDDAVWQELIPSLTETRVSSETQVREALQSFVIDPSYSDDAEDPSLYALRPYSHVKIYAVHRQDVDLRIPLREVEGLEVMHRWTSDELSSTVFVTRERTQPRWTSVDTFETTEHDLFVVHYNAAARLLFINSSRRTTAVYENIASAFSGEDHKILPLYQINRVLRGLRDLDCFSLGMRTRVRGNGAETYRIMTGNRAQNALGPTEGRLFNRGHVFAGATNARDEDVTIGYSSASKVWANKNLQIPELVDWCRRLADELRNETPVTTGGQLESLPLSRPATIMPSNVVAADWHDKVYRAPLQLETGEPGEACSLCDCELRVGRVDTDGRSAELVIATPWREYEVGYALGRTKLFTAGGAAESLVVRAAAEKMSLSTFLNNYYPTLYTADFSRLSGEEVFEPPAGASPYERSRIETWNWTDLGVDITNEAALDTARGRSIQAYLQEHLTASRNFCVVKDHGTGEVADFVAAAETSDALIVTLYHCKGSGGVHPGHRVDDLYDVCGQVVKSTWWANPAMLVARLRARVGKSSRVVKGEFSALAKGLVDAPSKPVRCAVVVVQPGIAASQLADAQLTIIAAADHYVRAVGFEGLSLVASP